MAYECTFRGYSLILNKMGWFRAHVISPGPGVHDRMYRPAGPPFRTLNIVIKDIPKNGMS
jgi:hypothetical protein